MRLYDIPVVLITVTWTVVIVHLRGGIQSGLLWVNRTVTGAPDLDNSFPAGRDNRHIGWGGLFGDAVSALSVSRRISTGVIGEPEEEPEQEREGSLEFVMADFVVSKQEWKQQ